MLVTYDHGLSLVDFYAQSINSAKGSPELEAFISYVRGASVEQLEEGIREYTRVKRIPPQNFVPNLCRLITVNLEGYEAEAIVSKVRLAETLFTGKVQVWYSQKVTALAEEHLKKKKQEYSAAQRVLGVSAVFFVASVWKYWRS